MGIECACRWSIEYEPVKFSEIYAKYLEEIRLFIMSYAMPHACMQVSTFL